MKKITTLIFLAFLLVLQSVGQAPKIAIIPEPVSINHLNGSYVLPAKISISAPDAAAVKVSVDLLKERFKEAAGVSVSSNAANPQIVLTLNAITDTALGNEGYRLHVTQAGISIKANAASGLYYGVQSLLQLFPPEIESRTLQADVKWRIPCVEIIDKPRFGWRGLMLDVSRHFFTKAEVKEYINQMARYKFNLLHWHLTDDEGWRIEIKSYPKLTQVGAWRVDKTGYFGDMKVPAANEPRTYGGYYTQDDIKEIVAYAKQHFVDVLPEIDVPGHSLAAIAAYPELSCTPGADKYVVRSGEKIINWYSGGFDALVDNALCPANEKVYEFLGKVFAEVAPLFPFEYIHIGGDECAHNFWAKNETINALMKKEGLKDYHELQSYFTRRMTKIIGGLGKKVIGWDEILEGGLAEGAAVMSWRGEKGGIAATQLKHEVVMSPTTYSYIDYMQGDGAIEPRVYSKLRLKKAYEFDPVPEGANAAYIKGGQANLWTEQVFNMRHAQYMTWPRGLATIESVWSPKAHKNWNLFAWKVEQHFKRLDVQLIKYAPSMFEPEIKCTKDEEGNYWVELETEVNTVSTHYTFDNSFPDQFYPVYTKAIKVPVDASMLRVVTYRGKDQKGRMITISIDDLKKRVPAKK